MLIAYLIWCTICFIVFAYTPLGEGWRQVRGQRIIFTPPLLARVNALNLGLFGPVCILISQDTQSVTLAIICTLLFGTIGLLTTIGVQEFCADVEAGTYYTRRGFPGFASKKTGRLDELRGVQMNGKKGYSCTVFILRPGDKKYGAFQIGFIPYSYSHATAAARQACTDLRIPLLPNI